MSSNNNSISDDPRVKSLQNDNNTLQKQLDDIKSKIASFSVSSSQQLKSIQDEIDATESNIINTNKSTADMKLKYAAIQKKLEETKATLDKDLSNWLQQSQTVLQQLSDFENAQLSSIDDDYNQKRAILQANIDQREAAAKPLNLTPQSTERMVLDALALTEQTTLEMKYRQQILKVKMQDNAKAQQLAEASRQEMDAKINKIQQDIIAASVDPLTNPTDQLLKATQDNSTYANQLKQANDLYKQNSEALATITSSCNNLKSLNKDWVSNYKARYRMANGQRVVD